MLEYKRMDDHLWPQPFPEGMISFSLWANFSSGINIWFALNWSDQLCPDLNWSPRQAKTPNRPCHCLLFFSCLDIVINCWMTAHCKFLMRDFEIRRGGKQLQFMAWSYSISRAHLRSQSWPSISSLVAPASCLCRPRAQILFHSLFCSSQKSPMMPPPDSQIREWEF